MKQRISYFLVSLFITFCFAAEAQIPAPAEMTTLDDFSDGNFNLNPQWNVIAPSDNWTVSGGVLRVNELNGTFAMSTPFTIRTDAWQFDYVMNGGFAGQILDYFFFMTSASNDPRTASGYRVRYQLGNTSNVVSLQTVTNGVAVNTIASFNNGLTNSLPRITIRRKNNTWEFYVGSTLRGTGSDATYSNSICAFQGLFVFLPNSSVPYNHGFDNIRYRTLSFGEFATAPALKSCNGRDFYFSTTGVGVDRISFERFTDTSFGAHVRNSNTIIFRGAQIKTFRASDANVCVPIMFYRTYLEGSTPGNFNSAPISFRGLCSGNNFPGGSPCTGNDQLWESTDLNLNLTTLPVGKYTIEVYYKIPGNNNGNSPCSDTVYVDNGGANYRASFSIIDPALSSANSTTCNTPANGSVTISGLVANSPYTVTYIKDPGTNVGPLNLTSDANGNIVISGLDAGSYSSFSVSDGCKIDISGSVTITKPSLTLTPSSNPNTVCNGTPGGTPGGCVPDFGRTGVVINEVRHFPPGAQGLIGTGTEYVELYNPTCNPIDISCYMIGARQNNVFGGAIIIPEGTLLLPKSHYVIGTSSSSTNTTSVDFKTNLNTLNYCVTSQFVLANGDGWIGLYDKGGNPLDAIYWTLGVNEGEKINNNDDDLNDSPCTPPSVTSCSTAGISLLSATQINAQFPSRISYVGKATSVEESPTVSNGKTFSRVPDGGTWQRNIDPSIDGINCNGGTCPPPPPPTSTGTCNGTVSVAPTGSGSFKYEWKNGNTAIGKDSAGVGNLCAGTYKVIVTDKTTGCIDSTEVTVANEVPQVNPAFTQVPSICNGGSFTLPTTSTNNITGTWSPAIDNTKTTTYTFTPTTGQCANTATMTVTVNQPVTPLFTQVSPICNGGTFTLPTTSNNNITGSWSPAIDNTKTTTYTFTPTDGQCATTTSMTVTVNEKKLPTITCGINTANSVEFKWDAVDGATSYDVSYDILNSGSSPINSTGNTATVFTVSGLNTGAEVKITVTPVGNTGSCFESASFTCKALACTVPTVNTTPNTVCKGTGGTPGGCVSQGTGVVINEVMAQPADVNGCPVVTTLFGTGPSCQGITVREYIELYNPTCDTINISCHILSAAGGINTGFTIVIPAGTKLPPKSHYVIGSVNGATNPNDIDLKIDPNSPFLCANSNSGPLMANGDGWLALNNSEGNVIDAIYWTLENGQSSKITNNDSDLNYPSCSPSVIPGCVASNVTLKSATQIYTQSPNLITYAGGSNINIVGTRAIPTGKTFSRIPDGGNWQRNVDPSIDGNNCNGGNCDLSTPGTPATCNGTAEVQITGNAADYSFEWKDGNGNIVGSSQKLENLCDGTYSVKVTNTATGCIDNIPVTVADDIIQVTPTFDTNLFASTCQDPISPAVLLPETSNNGIKGKWSPVSKSSAVAGDISYTFTPDAGQCADPVTFIQKVNPRVTPTFDFNLTSTICSGDPTTPNNLPGVSNNNIIGSWSPTPISSTQSDVYTFTPLSNACANTATLTVTVIQRPNVTVRPDTTLYHNAVYPGDIFGGLPTGSTVSWVNSNPGIGLPSSGNGNVPAFTAVNVGSAPVTATITVNSTNGNCAGQVKTYKITVLPLNRDVFVPNVFTPNGDAKNDQLFVFGNYITKLEMRIFNQWGELVKVINNSSAGWDGTHKGKPQPVGVYVYTLRATLADGTEVNKKGSITLLR